MVRTLLVAAALLFAAGGCGKNEAVKAVESLADEVCACADAQCARDVWAKKGSEMIRKYQNEKGSASDKQAIEAAGLRMRQCMMKLK